MTRPSLSVRAFAELLHMPAYEQLRILHEQKHPRREPQIFRIPYYQPALSAMRRFYHQGAKREVLEQARAAIKADVRPASRRVHNLRVLDAFEHSDEAARSLALQPAPRMTARIGDLDLRLRFNAVGRDESRSYTPYAPRRADGAERHIFYNVRAAEIDAEIARTTLEVAYWVMQQSEDSAPSGSRAARRASVGIDQLELFDFVLGERHVAPRLRARTVTRMERSAEIVRALWTLA